MRFCRRDDVDCPYAAFDQDLVVVVKYRHLGEVEGDFADHVFHAECVELSLLGDGHVRVADIYFVVGKSHRGHTEDDGSDRE